MSHRVTVYVPRLQAHSLRDIARGSGIVGRVEGRGIGPDAGADMVQIYYEGNIYGASNLTTYADRLVVAAERMASRSATTAQRTVSARLLVEVGFWDPATRSVHVQPGPVTRMLAAWIGEGPDWPINARELV